MDEISFFPNTGDGTHCYQAALKMVLSCFDPKEWSYEELNQISDKQKGKWTWPTASFLWLLNQGYEVRLIEEFDYSDFAKRGYEYLLEKSGKEIAEGQAANSDLASEQGWAKKLAAHPKFQQEHRIPLWQDLDHLLAEDYGLICNVNACKLYDKPGYSAHFVVPMAVTSTHILLHDPGLPPKPDQRVLHKPFEKAWGYPTDHEKNLVAIGR